MPSTLAVASQEPGCGGVRQPLVQSRSSAGELPGKAASSLLDVDVGAVDEIPDGPTGTRVSFHDVRQEIFVPRKHPAADRKRLRRERKQRQAAAAADPEDRPIRQAASSSEQAAHYARRRAIELRSELAAARQHQPSASSSLGTRPGPVSVSRAELEMQAQLRAAAAPDAQACSLLLGSEQPSEIPLVLDVCCGAGGFTWAALMAGWQVAGVDWCATKGEHYLRIFSQFGVSFSCKDITRAADRQSIVADPVMGSARVMLFSPSCQPFCFSGRKRPDDPRVQVLIGGVELASSLLPDLLVIECVVNLERCKWNPVWVEFVLPTLTGTPGYSAFVARTNASRGGAASVPQHRHRMFAVFSRYPRSGVLERLVGELELTEPLPMAAWFPPPCPRFRRHKPCRQSPATFDAQRKPAPCSRTSCLEDVDLAAYKRQRSDVCDPRRAAPITVRQRRILSGLPGFFTLPSRHVVCELQRCCGQGRVYPLASVLLGNIVVSPQALLVLQASELPLRPQPFAPTSPFAVASAEFARVRQAVERLPAARDAASGEACRADASDHVNAAAYEVVRLQTAMELRLVRAYVACLPSSSRHAPVDDPASRLCRRLIAGAVERLPTAQAPGGQSVCGYVLPALAPQLPPVVRPPDMGVS